MDQPIGVIDSGVGGLTVAKEIMRQLPKEELIYLGDTLRCPYGSRPKEEVIEFTWQMVHFLMKKNIKMLVVACNTATAFTLEELKRELPIPVVGVIQPGARAAIKVSQTMNIGVIGTEGTINSKAYPKALATINPTIMVEDLACPSFVPMVEKGVLDGPEAEFNVTNTLEPLKAFKEMDTLILGCTHYPLIQDVIHQVMGDSVNIICSSEETAREVSVVLDYYQQLYKGDRVPKHQFLTTGNLDMFQKIADAWFEQPIELMNSIKL